MKVDTLHSASYHSHITKEATETPHQYIQMNASVIRAILWQATVSYFFLQPKILVLCQLDKWSFFRGDPFHTISTCIAPTDVQPGS